MKRILTFILTIIPLLWFTGCRESDDSLRIGLINPDNGELATYGEKIQRGIAIAEEEINAKDMLQGRKVRVFKKDTWGDRDAARKAVKNLIGIRKVRYIIGEISSDATEAALDYTKTKGVFLFSPGAATPKLTDASVLFARNWPSNSAEAVSAADYAYDSRGDRTAIIVYVNNEWGIGLQQSFEKRFKEKGGTIVRQEEYPYTNADFRPLITRLRNTQADLIYLAGNQREMGQFMKQLREYKVALPVIANTSFLESDCLTLAGDAADGVIVPTPSYDPDSAETGKMKSFSDRYKAKYGSAPSLVDANGYDALMLIVEAVNAVGDDPYAVGAYIRNLKDYQAAGGTENFVNGDVFFKNDFKIVKDGAAVPME